MIALDQHLEEAVFFPFDYVSLPFSNALRLELVPGKRPGQKNPIVLGCGPPGSPDDQSVHYYGTVIQLGDTLHMWYSALSTLDQAPQGRRLCYATSADGIDWEKPTLGLVEFNGHRDNNIVDLFGGEPCIAASPIIHDPEDPDPDRCFKMSFESGRYNNRQAVAYSPDGLSWTESPANPVGPALEQAGLIKFDGCYYVNGQDEMGAHGTQYGPARKLVTFASYDFERWTQCSCLGFRRDNLPPRPMPTEWNQGEEVHLGAGLWNRGNVIIGVYGAWHGHPSGDRRWITMDLGLVVSNDALLYREPVPDYKLIPAYEELGVTEMRGPALMQGQGMYNVGDETLFWYEVWAWGDVRLARWERDRLGFFQTFPTPGEPHCISDVIDPQGQPVEIFANVEGVSEHADLSFELLDPRFYPIEGCSGEDRGRVSQPGLQQPVNWPRPQSLNQVKTPFRLKINFEGLTADRIRLYAAYVRKRL